MPLDEADELQWMARGYQKLGGIIWFAFWILGTARLYRSPSLKLQYEKYGYDVRLGVNVLTGNCGKGPSSGRESEFTRFAMIKKDWSETDGICLLQSASGSGWKALQNFVAILHWKATHTYSFPCCPLPCREILNRLAVGSCPWRATRVPCKAGKTGGWVAQRVRSLAVNAGSTSPTATRFHECRTLLTSRGCKRSSCRPIGKGTHLVPVAVVSQWIFEATENIEALESEHDALLLEACRNSEKLENMFLSIDESESSWLYKLYMFVQS